MKSKEIRNSLSLRYCLAIALLSLLITAALIIWAFPPINKYRAELLEETTRGAGLLWYYDLDGDGYSEKIKYGRGENVKAAHIWVASKGKTLDQWNLDNEMVLFHPAYGDFNQNGLAEVYVFTQRNDSLFGNWFEPYNKKSVVHTRFISTFRRRNGKADFGVVPCGLVDGYKDGFEKFTFLINAGFSLQPRNIFVWDIKNDSVYTSPHSGAAIRHPVVFDLDDDGQLEILVQSFATGNFQDNSKVPYSDKYCWLMTFNDRAEFLFEPLNIGEYPSNVMTVPYNTANTTCIAALYYYAGTEKRECSIKLYSAKGRLIRERKLGNFDNKMRNATLFSANPAKRDHLYLVYGNGEIEEMDSMLTTIAKYSVPGVYAGMNEYKESMMDIDGDGTNELLFDGKEGDLVITRSDFSHPVSIPLPKGGETWYTTILKGESSPELFITNEKNAFIFSYALNPLHYFKFPVYIGIYAFVFLLLFAARRIFKKIRLGLRDEDKVTSCLTEREMEIFLLLAKGMTNRQVADKLFISEDTVKTHRKKIKKKTGLKSTEALIAHAHKQQLI